MKLVGFSLNIIIFIIPIIIFTFLLHKALNENPELILTLVFEEASIFFTLNITYNRFYSYSDKGFAVSYSSKEKSPKFARPNTQGKRFDSAELKKDIILSKELKFGNMIAFVVVLLLLPLVFIDAAMTHCMRDNEFGSSYILAGNLIRVGSNILLILIIYYLGYKFSGDPKFTKDNKNE